MRFLSFFATLTFSAVFGAKAGALPVSNGGAAIETVPIEAVSPAQLWYGFDDPAFDRVVNIYTATPARQGTFIFLVGHRPYEAFTQEPFYDFLGFDGGAIKVPLGLRYGVLDRFDLGILRLNPTQETFATYQADVRYQMLKQDRYGADLAAVAGLSWFVDKNSSSFGGFGQLIASRIFFGRLHAGAAVLYHSHSTNPAKTTTDHGYSAAVAAFADLRLATGLAWSAEISETVAGFGAKYPNWTTGPKIITHRHTFALIVTNTQYVGADGIVTNSDRGLHDLIFGFNLTREL
jgi:hypothetical protein